MNATINTSMGAREWLMLLTLSVVWGGSFFFVELIVTDIPPLTTVFLRVALAAVALWIYVLLRGVEIPRSAMIWFSFAIMGLLNNVIPFTLITWGQVQIESGLAAMLNATTPLSTILIAGVMLSDERLTRPKVIGVILGILGVIVMIGPSALSGLGDQLLAQLAVIAATVSYGFANIFGRRFRTMNISPAVTAAGQVTASTLWLLPISLYIDKPFSLPMPGATAIAAVIGIAVISTAFAYILYFKILSSAGASNASLVTLLVPVSAILLGWLVLGERLEWIHFVGMGLIGLGLLVIDGRLWRKLVSSQNP